MNIEFNPTPRNGYTHWTAGDRRGLVFRHVLGDAVVIYNNRHYQVPGTYRQAVAWVLAGL